MRVHRRHRRAINRVRHAAGLVIELIAFPLRLLGRALSTKTKFVNQRLSTRGTFHGQEAQTH